MQLTACTISGNSGSAGGGIYNEMYPGITAHATLIDTIVAGNTAPAAPPAISAAPARASSPAATT